MKNIQIGNFFTKEIILNVKEKSLKEVIVQSVEKGVNLQYADLRGVNLEGVNLNGANLEGAYLNGANLEGTYLNGAKLNGAKLHSGYFRDVYFRSGNLSSAYFNGANLNGANLFNTYFRGADLRDVNLHGANLNGADFHGTDLRGVNLVDARLNWQSHDLIAEILRQASGDDVEKLKIAGLVLILRDWCYRDFLRLDDSLKDWVLDTLSKCVKDDDGAPRKIRDYNTN